MDAAVSVSQLSVRFPGRFRTPPVEALCAVDLQVGAGEIVGVLGPNGSGKTTLLQVLGGLQRPGSGTVAVLGTAPGDRRLVRRVGYQAEGPPPFPNLSGPELLQYLGSLLGLTPARIAERAGYWLGRLDLDGAGRRRAGTYSQGMVRRLALAAALLADPEVLLLDEPTAGLDPRGSLEVMTILRELTAAGRTVVLTSHQLEEVEQLCQRVVVLHRGRVAAAGTLDELLGTGDQHLWVSGLEDAELTKIEALVTTAGGTSRREFARRHLFALFRDLGR